MDSGLLNVFHDDPFDGNYSKFDNDTDFWSSGSETMGMQLTETLHGILPIAATDDVANSIYANAMIRDDFQIEHKDDSAVSVSTLQSKNALLYDNYAAEQHLAAGGTIEIVTMDPNAITDSYDSESDDDDDDDEDDDDDDDEEIESDLEGVIGVDQRSQHSNSTFRTRTDSSSIGDYESHSSDYDDETDIDDNEEAAAMAANATSQLDTSFNLMAENVSGLLGTDDLILNSSFKLPLDMIDGGGDGDGKNRTFSTNTIGSDVDGLGLQIDASTFDLADFITKDDFAMSTACMPSPIAAVVAPKPILSLSSPTTKTSIARPVAAAAVPLLQQTAPVVHVINSRLTDSDSEDSDVIVDVETVEMDSEDEEQMPTLALSLNATTAVATAKPAAVVAAAQVVVEAPYVDNVRSDPSWSPKHVKKNETAILNEFKPQPVTPPAAKVAAASAIQQPSPAAHNFGRNFSLVPSKRQCDFLKGKYGVGRGGKNVATAQQQQRNAKLIAAKKMPAESSASTSAAAAGNKKTTNSTKVASKTEATKKTAAPTSAVRKMGMGRGGKNLALIKHDHQSTSEQSSEDNVTPVKSARAEVSVATAAAVTVTASTDKQPSLQKPQVAATAVKRKLNLEEYKKRRGDASTATTTNGGKVQMYKIPKLDATKPICSSIASATAPTTTTPIKHSEAVTSIVRTLKAQQQQRPQATDPITEARNKVLRMQELKRAQQLRIIDSAVSAKVPRVTKMLPLRDIIKESDAAAAERRKTQNNAALQLNNSDYEEIIIVSASCNTDISMAPKGGGMLPQLKNASRSLLKSSALLYNISNTFQKVQQQAASDSSFKISNNSLLNSIQDAVVKQTAPTVAAANAAINAAAYAAAANAATAAAAAGGEGAKKSEQHGENKIIMHLRKDRVRQRTLSIATQTDFVAEFPPLPLPKATTEAAAAAHKSRERTRRKYRKRNVSISSASSSSSGSSDDNGDCASNGGGGAGGASYRSRSRSADSCSSAASLALTDRVAGAAGGYSSRSSRRHRSSVSSSYSESDRRAAAARSRRHRRSSYKQHRSKRQPRDTSSSSMSDYSARSSRSRTRSRSPHYRQRSRSPRSKRNGGNGGYPQQQQQQNNNNSFVDRNVSQPAVEERRIVYVGRIEQETTKEMLRRKFLAYGNIKQITIHYKDTGMKYGFVTYERKEDAFNAIETSANDSQINMYDISFGGRRAFCRASYADLDNAGINTYQSFVYPKAPAPPREEDSFEALLQKVKAKINASKPPTAVENGAKSTSKI